MDNMGKVYKIVCNITHEIYIGSTSQSSLNRRLSLHKSNLKQCIKGNKFNRPLSSHKILERGDFYIDLIEECNKEELLMKERYYIENLACVNKNIPHRNSYEYRLANIDKKKEYDRLRYLNKKNNII